MTGKGNANMSLNRPPPARPIAGSLGFELFQHAYVVRDLDAAIAGFRDYYGVSRFTTVPLPPLEGGASLRIGVAWSAGQLIELIEARGPGMEFYSDWLGEEAGSRLHHFGYLVEDDEQWGTLVRKLEEEGKPHIFAGDGGICQFIYVYAPELGHYFEFVYPNAEGKAFFESVPTN